MTSYSKGNTSSNPSCFVFIPPNVGVYSSICNRSSNFCPTKKLTYFPEELGKMCDLPMCQVGLLGEASLQAGEASDQVPPFAPRASLKSPEIQSTPIFYFFAQRVCE